MPLLRIGFETRHWVVPQYFGGLERTIQRLSYALVERGHNVSVFTEHNFQKLRGKIVRTNEGPATNPISVFHHQDMTALVQHLELLSIQGKLDIVQIGDIWGFKSDPELLLRVMRLPVPIVWNTQNQGMFAEFPHPPDIFQEFALRVNKFVAISRAIAEEAASCGISPDKIAVIYNPVDPAVYHPLTLNEKIALRRSLELPVGKTIVLNVGRLADFKGTDFLLESWGQRNDPSLYLIVVGLEHPLRAHQYDIYRQRYSNSAKFTGLLTDEKRVADYYQASDIFVFPSRLNEGLGNVLVEAMACGLPCIVSQQVLQTTGVRELIIPGNNGTVIKEFTTQSLFSAIHEARKNPIMGENGLRKFRKMGLTIDKATDQYEKIYKELTQRTTGQSTSRQKSYSLTSCGGVV